MATYTYKTAGTCSVQITFDLTGDIVSDIRFTRGCNGNTQGVSTLADGMRAEDLIKKLDGIRCEGKPTSYPDQLARAVRQALEDKEN